MPAQGPSQRHAEGFTTHGAGRQHEQGAERSEDAGQFLKIGWMWPQATECGSY